MKVESEEDARQVLADRSGDLPPGHGIVARRVGGTNLWSVNVVDDQGRGYVGSNQLVGPDGRLWRFSSNPQIHDWHIVERVLVRLYNKNAAENVDESSLADRIKQVTVLVEEEVRKVVKDAQSGILGSPSK